MSAPLIRVFLSILFQYGLQIIAVDPNLGNEMGRGSGDKVETKGNEHMNAKQRIFQFTLSYLSLLISLYFRWDDPVSIIDYLYFVIAIIGVIGCFWTYRIMGKFYTFTIGIRKDHELVTEGPYQYIMHPGYLFQLLILLSGVCFYNVNLFLTLSLIVYTLLVYRKRIIAEENMLKEEFGDKFREYKSTRQRLIPYVY